tara:strand:+ start:187 stop:423 length:237 start_codon:yes stop_codon:yes gene_type:complete
LAISGVAAAKKTKTETNSLIDLSKLSLSWHKGDRAFLAISARIKHQRYNSSKIQENKPSQEFHGKKMTPKQITASLSI